ncbi:MAG: redoxin domain-containing protein [Bacteroidia bacterium]|nr:redoxin domain-containing protein [Bacteroidia bacterium]
MKIQLKPLEFSLLLKKMLCVVGFVGTLAFPLNVNGQTSVQSFTLTNMVNGKPVSLDQYSSSGIAVVFTSNECPFDNYYKERIKELIGAYSGKVQFLLVNSYIETEESPEKMAIHYTDVNAPYLSDKDQVAMTALGAKKSPEVFLLKKADGNYAVVYSGAIDDNPQVAGDVDQKFLKVAIDKLLAGQKIGVANNRAVGCSIRRK